MFVNNVKVTVKPGTTILNACAEAGVEVTRFCYHESYITKEKQKMSVCVCIFFFFFLLLFSFFLSFSSLKFVACFLCFMVWFLFLAGLSIAGNCRMCLVEVEKSPKPVASCAMPVMPNMKVFTNTKTVRKVRQKKRMVFVFVFVFVVFFFLKKNLFTLFCDRHEKE